MLQILNIINIVIGLLFVLCYSYQIFYIIVALVKKPHEYPETEKRGRYAFMISARNEEDVIGQLCDSIRAQNYPAELVDIMIVADNCTDSTAAVARAHGAKVYERFNKEQVGKGYALTFLFDRVRQDKGTDYYDGYFIVDADNLLDENYVLEMNKAVMDGRRIVVCYRNSKNYGENWLASGSSLWFLRASKHLNNPRTLLGVSCEVNGTGFFVHRDVIERQGGWIHHLLIEDIEFTVDNVIKGEIVAYCHRAMVYDEQPTSFSQSWWQRKRWTKGYLQVLKGYGWTLIKRFFTGKGFSNFDMLMAISPAMILTFIAFVVNLAALAITLFVALEQFPAALLSIGVTMVGAYVFFFFVGLVSGITEWNNMHAPKHRRVLSLLTFPAFMYTYIPIVAATLFSPKVEWKQIKHNAAKPEQAPKNHNEARIGKDG
ncbi:MAG: glycosyltransferase family 2 protein [Clostridia bacterium]|nr:glycosyltransferase family 2 protein [Clostridia bacterium]